MSDPEARARGMAKMQEVYGWSVDPDDLPGEYIAVTVDHLFGTIWSRPELELHDAGPTRFRRKAHADARLRAPSVGIAEGDDDGHDSLTLVSRRL